MGSTWLTLISIYRKELIGDKHKPIPTDWVALYVNDETITYFHSFGVEHIRVEMKLFLGNKNILAIIYRVQVHKSIMCGYFCIFSEVRV